jgi:hypothetical protein
MPKRTGRTSVSKLPHPLRNLGVRYAHAPKKTRVGKTTKTKPSRVAKSISSMRSY